jgi:amino acid permease
LLLFPGILAMPLAFSNSGLWFGFFATIVVGAICTYCISILGNQLEIYAILSQITLFDFF